MIAGMIAAGDGTRLAARHPGLPKPLVPVAGRPLCHWAVEGLVAAGATELALLTNSRGGAVAPSLRAAFPTLVLDAVTADTASSFESFRLVSRRVAAREGAFLLSTVDAVIPPAEVARFWRECRASGAEAGLALTAHVDDEKPLWADAEGARVVALGEKARRRDAVTCGLYYMTAAAAAKLPAADAHGRLRDFWASLVDGGTSVAGVLLGKTLDVDRPEDILEAERFLTTETQRRGEKRVTA